VLVVGAVVTIALVLVTRAVHEDNEDRLLQQRAREAGSVLTAALPGIQTPLASAAEVVDVTDGTDQDAFRRLMSPLVDAGNPYVSASLWRLDDQTLQPEIVVGEAPKLASQPPEVIMDFFDRAVAAEGLGVIGLLDGDDARLGYSFTPADPTARFVAYAEAVVATERIAPPAPDTAFSGLDFAIYLGEREDPDALLRATTADLPVAGRRASELVPFGDTALLLVTSPTEDLGGALMASLPWLVAVVGVATTVAAAALTERLVRGRNRARGLARENAHLYTEQRSVARALQQALLPDRLPDVAGLELAAEYLPGAPGVEIGGDWYDVVPVDEHRVVIVVGDVSGRGVPAATVMATLRYTIRAFASEGHQPAAILSKLSNMLDVERDGHFATIVCATIDVRTNTLRIANAGHPSPLLVDGDTVTTVEAPVGVPIGVANDASYGTFDMAVREGSTLLAFTDGLFERRAESVDDGLERLRRSALASGGTLRELLAGIVELQRSPDGHDDTAILGVRWTTRTTTSN
jgi:serine phosphatase RsbU (regulator of sigma subunit)/type II secretory pathway pseudopilin PulG